MESICIELRENERCPAGLEILLNQPYFTINLNPKGGVGDFEIINSKGEVVLIGQKHLATISLLEHTSRSEVLTLDLSNLQEMTISCPPTEDIAVITNPNMGLFSENSLEILSKSSRNQASSKQHNFKFQPCAKSSGVAKNGNQEGEKVSNAKYNFQVINDSSVVVAELLVSRLSSKVRINLPGHCPLTPVQAAVIFGGLAFQIYSIKKQKSLMVMLIMGSLLVLLATLILIYVMVN